MYDNGNDMKHRTDKINNTEDIPRLCRRQVLSDRTAGARSPTGRKRSCKSPLLVKSRALKKKTDYSCYKMNAKETAISIFSGFSGGTAAFYIFFGKMLPAVVFGLIAVIFALKKGNNFFKDRRNRKLLSEFKDFLEMYTASLSSGKNAVSALAETQSDLEVQYGKNSVMANELKTALNEVYNGGIPETAISDFAERSGMQDIKNFAETFRLCRISGGDLKEAVSCSYGILSEKTRIRGEIEVIVSKGKNEMKIMAFLPLAVVPVMKMLGEGSGQSDPAGITVRIVGALIIAAAYFIGLKITDIKI